MAFITKSNDTKCYSCGKQCINVEFCSAGGSYNNDDIGSQGISLSRNIRVVITANPDFWGFGGTLISGWATYNNGYYDFFDGFDEDHSATKTCTVGEDITKYGPFKNEQRPDIFYRSVYDPDLGITKHYSTTLEGSGAGRGGAEVYLINRPAGLVDPVSSDGESCSYNNPTSIFRQFPENYGWGNKINFNTKIYKNLTGAWRLSSLENCYSNANLYKPSGYLIDCSGNEKQNIIYEKNRYANYAPSRLRGSGHSDYYDYIDKCYPDGAVAGKYSGRISEISRELVDGGFIKVSLYYGSNAPYLAASGLKNGMSIGIKTYENTGIFNNVYTIFNVTHQPHSTTVSLVGTSTGNIQLNELIPTGAFTCDIDGSGHWVAFNTYDPQTCCGLNAYGVSNEDKSLCGTTNYHVDFRRVFNNPKNLRQSNRDREWRNNYDIFNTISPASNSISGRFDPSYVSVSGIEVSGISYGYPIIVSGNSAIIATGGAFISGYPLLQRELSYYGNFFDTDKCDNLKRFDQAINRGKASNATCYSKHATLEIFPDCVTQYDSYDECVTTTEKFVTNRIPRLAFVYRGCDFNDDCSFDSSGLPLGAWKNQGSMPAGIDDLKRQLAGQEIHMFINLGTAWGGRKPGSPCQCDCDGEIEGQFPPEHVEIPSPLTFASFPNFDLDPSGYGCQDGRYQARAKMMEGVSINYGVACTPLPSSAYACLKRQPYTTYGYIMNLCGKETIDRKSVIASGFAKLHQEKTYTNKTPTGNIAEPMYWNVIAPNPSPAGGTAWSSGTTGRSDGVGNFQQIGGNGYGFWGLADSNKQVVAPYFVTKSGSNPCCENTGYYLEYNSSGTFTNILGTVNGWPTSAVPFLIELEVDDSCVGCVSTNMKSDPLHLEIEGLNTDFIWNQLITGGVGGRFGHNFCKYGASGPFGKGKTDAPTFSCTTGFSLWVCTTGDTLKATYGQKYVGNTCSCVDGLNITLYPVMLSGTDIPIGWTSNTIGGGAGMIELTGCKDLTSRYIDSDLPVAEGNGYRIFAQFDLACNGLHQYLTKPYIPDISYNGNPVISLWGNSAGCSHHYPARVGDYTDGEAGDLDLRTQLYLIADTQVPVFRELTDRGLKYRNLIGLGVMPGITWSDFYPGGPLGVCPGDTVYAYGCDLGGYFYGCLDGNGYGPGSYVDCSGNTLCNTCPTGVESGDVTCICDAAVGYEGIIPRRAPGNYQFNECFCQCSSPSLIATYVASSSGTLDPVSFEGCPEAVRYWASTEDGPIIPLLNLPPQPYIGIQLAGPQGSSPGIGSADWYDYSHGVNAIGSGIKNELYAPWLQPEDYIPFECDGLRNTMVGSVIECESTACSQSTSSFQKTCAGPIYNVSSSGVNVRRKKCHPEIAIVTKIECITTNRYKLYISREYHEHDRSWKKRVSVQVDPEMPSEEICLPYIGAYFYNDGSTSGCEDIPYALIADSVTPAYASPCSINPSSGVYVTQDFKYEKASFPSGAYIWNYFNLFYSSGFLPTVANGYLQRGIPYDIAGEPACTGTANNPNTTLFSSGDYINPAGFNGIFATNKKHSCVQDSIQCGGELWCNKLFFPRRSYKAGTRIAPFGAPSICTANNELKNAFSLDGYRENSQTIDTAKDLLAEQKLRFFDWCNDDIIETGLDPIGIDDTEIYVRDYLPLIGVLHPGWRFTSDIKSCTIASSGCGFSIPTHNENTILMGVHQPKTFTANAFDSMGYYLDRFGVSYKDSPNLVRASGVDNCLFNPFKILIDVECSLNRIARKQFPTDPPTYLQGIQTWPAETCLGMVGNPGCACSDTKCNKVTESKKGSCTKFVTTAFQGTAQDMEAYDCTGGCSCSGCSLVGGTPLTGKFIVPGTPDARLLSSDVLEDLDVDGIITSTIVCTCGGGYGGPPASSVYKTYGSAAGWKKNKCDGLYYLISEEEFWFRKFQCDSNQYLAGLGTAGFGAYDTQCDCEKDINAGLCTAVYRCSDFSTCDCNPVAVSGNLVPPITSIGQNPSGLWWQTDCGCEAYPRSQGPCSQDSLIKWTVTEE